MKTLMRAAAALVILMIDALLRPSRGPEEPMRASLIRTVVKHPWLTAAALGVIAVISAALVVVSGVVPIKASSGHWPITARFLDFAKLRSVATYSLTIEAPPLDDEALILRGAAHYESGCYPCHGRPGAGVPPVMSAMTPDPPQLTGDALTRYTPEQLFTIVRHGIKFTGMPAWPVLNREDEVWAVVAFLRRMPALDATAYRRLAYGDPGGGASATPDLSATGQPLPQAVRDSCWRCHGLDGTGRGPGAFPSLTGQRAEYLYASLRAFADRRRFSGIMSGVAATLSDDAMREVAAFYALLPSRQPERAGDPATIERGARIAARGVPDRDIPACAECHGPSDAPKNPMYPRLASQHSRYLAAQLDLLKARRRGGSPNVALMHTFVDRLSTTDIRDVTFYYGSLDWRGN
jgi:cytochrome c553